MQESTAPPATKDEKKFIQKVCGKFLFYGRAVDGTVVLTPISAIASQSANPTKDTLAQTQQLLDYLATQEDAVLTYNRSDMILAVHSDASYLSKPKARSRAGGHFFLSTNAEIPPNNGAILNNATIIKHVMSSATESNGSIIHHGPGGRLYSIFDSSYKKWTTHSPRHPSKPTTQWQKQ